MAKVVYTDWRDIAKEPEIVGMYKDEAETQTYLTADDEEPICTRCDHFGDDFNCSESCGASKGWYGYTRTIKEE